MAIGISYSGYSRDTVEMMRLARAAGVINQNYEKLSKQLKQNSKIIAQRAYPEEEKEI